jgi:hypothetical protein
VSRYNSDRVLLGDTPQFGELGDRLGGHIILDVERRKQLSDIRIFTK